MKRGIEERGPIASWLIRSRSQFRDPGSARSWTADEFLDALRLETGHAPARTTYARWESGAARPEPTSLAPVVAFYAERGLDGPDAPAAAAPAERDELVAALRAQTEAINALVARLDLLASSAVRDGVMDALREAGVLPAGAAS